MRKYIQCHIKSVDKQRNVYYTKLVKYLQPYCYNRNTNNRNTNWTTPLGVVSHFVYFGLSADHPQPEGKICIWEEEYVLYGYTSSSSSPLTTHPSPLTPHPSMVVYNTVPEETDNCKHSSVLLCLWLAKNISIFIYTIQLNWISGWICITWYSH